MALRNLFRSMLPLSAENLLAKVRPMTLVHFEESTSHCDKWKIVTDATSMHGESSGTVTILQERTPDGGAESFARFSGTLSKKMDGHRKRMRSGFASLRSEPFTPPKPLGEYDFIEVTLRSDGRGYVLNVGLDDFSSEDLYQGALIAGGGSSPSWQTLTLRFEDLKLTGRGRLVCWNLRELGVCATLFVCSLLIS